MIDIAIIGAGAAGLMTAVQCHWRGLTTCIFESQSKVGKKILISGGGRCNITNQVVRANNYRCPSNSLVKNILKHFTTKDTITFFEQAGVPLKTEEPFQKVFPVSDKAQDIIDVFTNFLKEYEIPLHFNHEIINIECVGQEYFVLHTSRNQTYQAKNVVLCTGGLSVPKTGSNGMGYQMAKNLSHTIMPLVPALTPLLLNGKDFQILSGYTLNCQITCHFHNQKKIFTGPLLFTHKGISGPVVLNCSSVYIPHASQQAQLSINWLPAIPMQEFEKQLVNVQEAKQTVYSILKKYFSKNFALYIMVRSHVITAISEEFALQTFLNQLTKEKRKKLLMSIYQDTLDIKGHRGFEVAEVTHGGIDCQEVDINSLQSKKVPKLYFAGEILDVDGELGGFNFQWAFASANAVANHLAKNNLR